MKSGGYQTSSKIVKDIITHEGLEAFRIKKIHCFETGIEAFNYEIKFLNKVRVPYNTLFLNKQVGEDFGNAGKKFSTEHKEKMAAAKIGKKRSIEFIKKQTGRNRSLESRKKQGESRKSKKLSIEQKAKISATCMGRHFSDETKAKISASKIGKKLGKYKPKIKV